MKRYIIIPILFMLISCTTNNVDSNTGQATDLENGIIIHLKDSDNNNLIGSDKYPENGIFADYLINGKTVKYIGKTAPILPDYPNNNIILHQNNTTSSLFFLNYSDTEEFPITYIHWNETDIDTIKAQFKRSSGLVGLEKYWVFKNNAWVEQLSGEITFVK